MTKEFVMTPAIEWLESEENEHKNYGISRPMNLIELKDDTCFCDLGDFCTQGMEFRGLTVDDIDPLYERSYYESMRDRHNERSPQLKYMGVAQ